MTMQKVIPNISLRWLGMVAAMILALTYAATPVPAQAINCSGDTWADAPDGNYTIHWQDNYVVGTGCDLNGEYTVGIQRINSGLGYTNSGIDGYYGPNTKQDIEDFQSDYGLDDIDGIVGSDTWDAYEDYLIADGWSGTWKYYKASGVARSWFQHTGLSPDKWYSRKRNATTTWVYFSTSGPA